MEFLDLVKKRHTTRIYEDKKIPLEDIKYILEAAQFAPTAFNAQNFKFIVVQNKGKIAKLAKATEGLFIAKAAAVVVAIGLQLDNKYNVVDVTIALDHLQLAAAERGIGSCWVGTMGHRRIEEIFDIKEDAKVFAVMSLGYDAGKLMPKKRKSFKELFEIEE